jgi:hypothetical protein
MPSMSRKRLVAALLLLVTLSLGAACYLQLSRKTGNTVADAAPASPPATAGNVEPVGEIAIPGEALRVAAGTTPAPTAQPASTAEETSAPDVADETAGEVSTVTMETVDMPSSSIVLASAADSGGGGMQPHSSTRFGSFRFGSAGGFGGSGGAGGAGSAGGSETQNQQPSNTGSSGSNSPGSAQPEGTGPASDTQEGSASDVTPPKSDTKDSEDSTPPKQDEEQQNNDEGEGPGEGPGEETGEQPPLVNEPPGDDQPPYEGPVDPPRDTKPVRVPEPSTLALLGGAGLLGLGFGRRRRSAR